MSAESQPELPGARPYPRNLIAGDLVANRYQLETQLNQWDAGVTWRAIDRTLSRRVVVHLFNPHSPETARALEAARRAAVAVGLPLRARPRRHGQRPALHRRRILHRHHAAFAARPRPDRPRIGPYRARTCRRPGPMHAEGLFHHRLNPDTVVVTRTGNVKIMGFLLEAALAGATSSSDNWARQEAEDVGRSARSCMRAWWRAGRSTRPWPRPARWGLPAAPMSAPGPDGPHWKRRRPASTRRCRPWSTPSASSPSTRPVRCRCAADEIVIALGRVLGTAEPTECWDDASAPCPPTRPARTPTSACMPPASTSSPARRHSRRRRTTPSACLRWEPDDPNWPMATWPLRGRRPFSPLGTTDTRHAHP